MKDIEQQGLHVQQLTWNKVELSRSTSNLKTQLLEFFNFL